MPFNRIFLLFAALFSSVVAFSQSSIDGNVFDRKNNKPLANVSVSVKKKKLGSLSDQKGHFKLSISNLKKSDTLELSSIGYSTLKIPLADALLVKDFFLSEESKNLEDVVIKSYNNHTSDGSLSEVSGYFSAWSIKKNSGEIGRIIETRAKEFKVEKVRFKINNQCDTCIVRLHIRNIMYGKPGLELLRDSITLQTGRSSFDDKAAEFDLTNKNIILKTTGPVYIGLETIYCSSAGNKNCNIAYIGTEEGSYIYRTGNEKEWETSYTNSLYIKMFYTY